MSFPEHAGFLESLAVAVESALKEAEIGLPHDVLQALISASARETDPTARAELENICANIREAKNRQVPLCQDTGVPVIFLTLPEGWGYTAAMEEAVRTGIERATASVPLRPNVVNPLSRCNTGTNTGTRMPDVHVRRGDHVSVTVLPKGAGSENVSRIGMLLPSERDAVGRFVAETMLLAGGRPCPPVVLGVGIGGTFDTAASLAKEALLQPIDSMTAFEQDLCNAVNDLGIGPMGLGGDTTALAVKVLCADCHTASLPVAVNVQCWACRRATRRVEE
ncbi:MAG: fumarate hydratase [Methanomicrobiales archaeon]|nr:fumarate hydratase [Methanomicrobiales archaeon]